MKKLFTLFIASLFITSAYSQTYDTSIVIQPGPADGKDVPLFEHSPNGNPDKSPEFISYYWNFGSSYSRGVSLIQFDIPEFDDRYEVQSAQLSLYHNANSGSAGQVGKNACNLKMVTSRWAEDTVTWKTKPSTTDNGQVKLEQSTSTTQDYPEIDITNFVKGWANNPKTNFGMMLEVIDVTGNQKSMKFCSSDVTNASKRPKLTINLIEKVEADTCIALQPGPSAGLDVPLFEHSPNGTPKNSPEFISYYWDFGSNVSKGISLLKFDLPTVPSSYQLVSAKLSLYHNGTSGSAGQVGNNASYLKKVTSNWSIDSVTWNTLPNTTNTHQVYLSASTSNDQDYPNIDITAFAKDWYSNPKNNHGLMLDIIENRNAGHSMKFCSSNCSDSLLRPKLDLCFREFTGINRQVTKSAFHIFPNPSSGIFTIANQNANPSLLKVKNISVYSSDGKLLSMNHFTRNNDAIELNMLGFASGVYFIKIITENSASTKKVYIE